MITPTPWFVTFVSQGQRRYLFFEYEEHAQAWQDAEAANLASDHPLDNGLFWDLMMATLGLTYGKDVVLATIKVPG